MKYVSTRGGAPALGFEEAMLTGLASDGGLYVPVGVPVLDDIGGLAGLSYEDAAFRVMRPFVAGAFSDDEFRAHIGAAYAGFGHAARAPLKQLDAGLFLLELFHGPTLAFKDFAMQLIGRLFQASLERSGRRITIVGATSGDTGSAAIEAFAGIGGVDVFILYPRGRVSEVQRRQMTTPTAANAHAVAVDGDFDDCQALLKAAFNDHSFRGEVGLAGVNSINFARVLAQVVYYFTAAAGLGSPHRPVSFCVPTGNFGDIYAGHLARRMGLPMERLVIATNQNDILHRTLVTGSHVKSGVVPSISPSMDIQVSSNFERALFDVHGGDAGAVARRMRALEEEGGFAVDQGALERLREIFASGRASEDETRAEIARTLAETGEILCPHSAVGVKVAREIGPSSAPMIALATAHPAKFPDAVEAAVGARPPLPPRMADLYERPERLPRLDNSLAALRTFVRERRSS